MQVAALETNTAVEEINLGLFLFRMTVYIIDDFTQHFRKQLYNLTQIEVPAGVLSQTNYRPLIYYFTMVTNVKAG